MSIRESRFTQLPAVIFFPHFYFNVEKLHSIVLLQISSLNVMLISHIYNLTTCQVNFLSFLFATFRIQQMHSTAPYQLHNDVFV